MESRTLDIIIGKGPSARTIQLELSPFTLIGATTRIGLLSGPLRSRFGGTFRLEFYSEIEIEKILSRSAKILGINVEPPALALIAQSSRSTPRTANRLLKRVRDYALVNGHAIITEVVAGNTLALLEIDEKGLEPMDRKILEVIIKKFNGGPVGVQAIAASAAEDEETVEEVYEPYLMRLGFLERTPRGRTATEAAYIHLGFARSAQKTLLI
jgi:Holliday junction DNA helicase RuvB